MPRFGTKIACFDTETSGVDVENDHIVTATILLLSPDGQIEEQRDWLIDFGGEIPEGASAVHGITTEHMREHGRKDVREALMGISRLLDIYDRNDIPVAIYNAPYDLTLLDRELRREVGYRHFRSPKYVIDPLVLDKGLDKFRPGSRKLVDVAPVYGVAVRADAHDAAADCVMTGQIALQMLKDTGRPWVNRPTISAKTGKRMQAPPPSPLPGMSFAEIHAKQIPTKRDQAVGFRAYLHKKADADKDLTPEQRVAAHAEANAVSGEWPMIPFMEPTDG